MLFLVILLALTFIVSNVLGANYHTIANADSPGYGDLVNAARDEANCKSYCDSTANCGGATLTNTNQCYLKSDIAKIVPSGNCNLLIKVVGPFLRIDSPPGDINLREVRLFNNGVQLFGLYATMSRTWADDAYFRPCIDNGAQSMVGNRFTRSTSK